MTAITVNPAFAYWGEPSGAVSSFRPLGRWQIIGGKTQLDRRSNPARWESDEVYAARLFVGFNIGDTSAFDLEDLIGLVRGELGEASAATFIAQKGLYTSNRTGETVEEDGAQVILFNLTGESPVDFRKRVIALAEKIARDFQQELVIAEFQKNGVVQTTVGVEP